MRDELSAVTPRLRRYARALVSGSPMHCDLSDSLVGAALMRTVGARSLGSAAELPARLYSTVTQLHRELVADRREEIAAGAGLRRPTAVPAAVPGPPSNTLAAALLSLPLDEREALLLVALERFDHENAARILRITRPVLLERLTRARTRLGQRPASFVAAPAPAAARVPYLRLVVG